MRLYPDAGSLSGRAGYAVPALLRRHSSQRKGTSADGAGLLRSGLGRYGKRVIRLNVHEQTVASTPH